MRRYVLDASVVVKWIFPERPDEPGADRALAILAGLHDSDIAVIQPPHWLAEVAAVCVRLQPQAAERAVSHLMAMELPIADSPGIYLTACELAERFNHHLFDTLYHAVALQEPGAVLVSADERYYQKARAAGAIVRLSEWSA